jgi:hypothetical protein
MKNDSGLFLLLYCFIASQFNCFIALLFLCLIVLLLYSIKESVHHKCHHRLGIAGILFIDHKKSKSAALLGA